MLILILYCNFLLQGRLVSVVFWPTQTYVYRIEREDQKIFSCCYTINQNMLNFLILFCNLLYSPYTQSEFFRLLKIKVVSCS
jgi:hypothetical protein